MFLRFQAPSLGDGGTGHLGEESCVIWMDWLKLQ